MARNRKSRLKKGKTPAAVTHTSPGRAAAANAPGTPGGPEGIFWPPFAAWRTSAPLSMQVQFEMSQWWEPERILFHQLAQLRNVITHAAKTTPFYKDRLETAVMQSKQGLSLKTFRQIPILTRGEFQNAGTSIHSTAVPASHGVIFDMRTSGSTGEPLALKGTEVTATYNSAKNLREDLWHRRDFSKKCLFFRTMKPGRTLVRSPTWGPAADPGEAVTVSMAQPAGTLLEIMKAEDPVYIVVHPSVLKELLYLSKEQGYRPANLKQVRTMGEILYPELRERCRRQWGVLVCDVYSCVEVGAMAIQCPEHFRYHVHAECTLIEVLRPDNTPCEPGEIGKTVISSLNNFATPILRYENGDMAEVGEPCACGRGLPILKRIVGRERNMAILPNGQRLMPNLSTGPLLTELPIKHFQLVQITTELIEARLVVGRPLTATEETALADYFNRGWQHEFDFTFAYLDEIARGVSGKYEVFRCEVPR